jgi:hypothetical protein
VGPAGSITSSRPLMRRAAHATGSMASVPVRISRGVSASLRPSHGVRPDALSEQAEGTLGGAAALCGRAAYRRDPSFAAHPIELRVGPLPRAYPVLPVVGAGAWPPPPVHRPGAASRAPQGDQGDAPQARRRRVRGRPDQVVGSNGRQHRYPGPLPLACLRWATAFANM